MSDDKLLEYLNTGNTWRRIDRMKLIRIPYEIRDGRLLPKRPVCSRNCEGCGHDWMRDDF